jgi:hypothetical protein
VPCLVLSSLFFSCLAFVWSLSCLVLFSLLMTYLVLSYPTSNPNPNQCVIFLVARVSRPAPNPQTKLDF